MIVQIKALVLKELGPSWIRTFRDNVPVPILLSDPERTKQARRGRRRICEHERELQRKLRRKAD